VFADLPLLTDLHEQGGDQPETRGLIWKDSHDFGPSADPFVNPLQAVGRAYCTPVYQRKVEDRKSFSQVFLHPGGQPRSRSSVLLDGLLKKLLRSFSVWCIEHGADVCCHFSPHGLFGHISPSVLL